MGERFLRVSYSQNERTGEGQLDGFDQKHLWVSRGKNSEWWDKNDTMLLHLDRFISIYVFP